MKLFTVIVIFLSIYGEWTFLYLAIFELIIDLMTTRILLIVDEVVKRLSMEFGWRWWS